jgi:hypothetical protein
MKKNFILMALILISVIATQVACGVSKSTVEKTVALGIEEEFRKEFEEDGYFKEDGNPVSANIAVRIHSTELVKTGDHTYSGSIFITGDGLDKAYPLSIDAIADDDTVRYQWDKNELYKIKAIIITGYNRAHDTEYIQYLVNAKLPSSIIRSMRSLSPADHGIDEASIHDLGLTVVNITQSVSRQPVEADFWNAALQDKYGTEWYIGGSDLGRRAYMGSQLLLVKPPVNKESGVFYSFRDNSKEDLLEVYNYLRGVQHYESGE